MGLSVPFFMTSLLAGMIWGEKMRNFIWMACFVYCLNGFGHIVLGTILEPMVDHYGIAYGDGGQLIMNQFLGFLVGVLVAPAIVKNLGRKVTVVLSLLAFATSQLMLGILPAWHVLLFTVPLGGAGIGILETVVAALIVGHLKERKASVLVLVEVFFGVGALLIPVISAFLIANGIWNFAFFVVTMLSLIAALLWIFLPFGHLQSILQKQSTSTKKNDQGRRRQRYTNKQIPLVIVGAFFFFMYVGTEMVLPNYLPTILSMTTNLGASTLALSITVFWAAMTIGRLFMTFVIERIGYSKLFVICCFGQLFSLTIFAISPTVIIGFIAIFLAGLLMGGIFSIGLLIVNERISGFEEWTTSILVAMGGLGGALLPKLVGEIIDRFAINVTLWVMVFFSLILVSLMVMIFYYRKNIQKS